MDRGSYKMTKQLLLAPKVELLTFYYLITNQFLTFLHNTMFVITEQFLDGTTIVLDDL